MGSQTAGSPPPEAVRAQVARILSSQAFLKAGRLRRLLGFIVEETIQGRDDRLKEYTLGLEVFGRDESFDPRLDSVVRVEMSRLRLKLEAYYGAEGRQDPIRVELPRGGYVPLMTSREQTDRPSDKRLRWPLAMAAVVVAVATAGWLVYAHFGAPAAIAVMPFRDLTPDRGLDYLAQGLSEEVTIGLVKVSGMRVLGRTSAAAALGVERDLSAAGRNLGVSSVLDGSIRRDGSRLRVAVELVSARDGHQLWGEVYDGEEEDVFGFPNRIVDGVARALRVRTTPRKTQTHDARTQVLYWRGRYFRSQRTPEGVLKSLDLFEQAIRRDADYAPAYSALADSYSMCAFHGLTPMSDAMPKARAAADKALALDPNLPEAHGVSAWMRFFYDWDWPAAEKEFTRAIELDPGYAPGRQCHAFALVARGRCSDAIAESRRALALDPLSYVASNDLGMLLYFCRQYGEAIDQARVTLEMRPGLSAARVVRGSACAMLGRHAEAIADLRAIPLSEAHLSAQGRLGYAYAVAGRREEARAILADLAARGRRGQQVYAQMAAVRAGLGETSEALGLLEESWKRREGEAVFIGVEPMLDPVRKDPRWRAFKTRLGL